jgi:hypothetical protein
MRAGISTHMTEEQFKFVLGCLHSDHPERSKERLDKAFTIFNRLQMTVLSGQDEVQRQHESEKRRRRKEHPFRTG